MIKQKKIPKEWLQQMILRRSVTSSYINGEESFTAYRIENKITRMKVQNLGRKCVVLRAVQGKRG